MARCSICKKELKIAVKLLHCPNCPKEFALCKDHKDYLGVENPCPDCNDSQLKPGPYRIVRAPSAVVPLKREFDSIQNDARSSSDSAAQRLQSPVQHSDESPVSPIIKQFGGDWRSGSLFPPLNLKLTCDEGSCGLFQESINPEEYLAEMKKAEETKRAKKEERDRNLPASQIDHQRLWTIFNGLGDLCWMEFIDFRCHKDGKTALDEGKGPEGQKEKFSKSMDAARAFAANNLGSPLTLEFYLEMFRLAAGHLGKENRFRGPDDQLSLGTTIINQDAIAEIRQADGAMEDVNTVEVENGKGFRVIMTGMNMIYIQELINGLFNEFHKQLAGSKGDSFGKLLAIAVLIQKLERLHPFRNANGRTNILLMNKLLTEHGFHPAILDDPNDAPFVTVMQWLRFIQKGLVRWRSYYECFRLAEKRNPIFSLETPDTVTIDGQVLRVGRVSGIGNQCLFNSTQQLLAQISTHPSSALTAQQLRELIIARHLERPGGVTEGHIENLLNEGMGTLADDIPALAAILGVRIQLYVLGEDNQPWLEFDSQGGTGLPILRILHRGIHFEPLFASNKTPDF